jgi:hypothetical protein
MRWIDAVSLELTDVGSNGRARTPRCDVESTPKPESAVFKHVREDVLTTAWVHPSDDVVGLDATVQTRPCFHSPAFNPRRYLPRQHWKVTDMPTKDLIWCCGYLISSFSMLLSWLQNVQDIWKPVNAPVPLPRMICCHILISKGRRLGCLSSLLRGLLSSLLFL